MITTDKTLIDFVENYKFVEKHKVNADFKITFDSSERSCIEIGKHLCIRASDYEFDIYIYAHVDRIDVSLLEISTECQVNICHNYKWFNNNHQNMISVVQEMLLNLSKRHFMTTFDVEIFTDSYSNLDLSDHTFMKIKYPDTGFGELSYNEDFMNPLNSENIQLTKLSFKFDRTLTGLKITTNNSRCGNILNDLLKTTSSHIKFVPRIIIKNQNNSIVETIVGFDAILNNKELWDSI